MWGNWSPEIIAGRYRYKISIFLNIGIKTEDGAGLSSHDIMRSITMIHCVPSASALRQWRPITFIWHFIAVRSQQLSAMLKGGHRLPVCREADGKEPDGSWRFAGGEDEREGWEKVGPPQLQRAPGLSSAPLMLSGSFHLLYQDFHPTPPTADV